MLAVNPELISNKLSIVTGIKQSIPVAENILRRTLTHGENSPGQRSAACGYSSDLFNYAFNSCLKNNNQVFEPAFTTNIRMIHALVDNQYDPKNVTDIWDKYQKAISDNDFDSPNIDIYKRYNQSFQHQVSIVRDNNRSFLVDLTFCQFIEPDGTICENKEKPTCNINDSPLAQELLQNGFIELTPENIIEFLCLTSLPELHSKYKSLSDENAKQIIKNIPQCPPELSEAEFLKLINS